MKRALLSLGTLLLLVAIALAGAAQGGGYGKTLGEWMELYWTWTITGDTPGQVGHVVFMPIPPGTPSEEDPTIFVGEADVTLKVGQPFVLPMLVWVGETYLEENVPDDNPDDFPRELFTGARVLIRMDNKTLIDSSRHDVNKYFFDVQYFDETLFYDEPVEYAPDVHAIGAIWVKGIGFVHPPLSKGRHTLTLFVYLDDFQLGFSNTWNITVTK